MKKRLQVFISSTFADLIPERQAAVEAILTAGHIPAGMELFTAGDQSQMDVIKRWIDESDVYLLIFGSRYGSVEPVTGKSYTQLEYEYAVKQGKALFSVVVDGNIEEKRVKERGLAVIERDNPGKLKAFRDQVLTKMVRFWKNTDQIKLAIHEAMNQIERRDSLTGWVKGSESSSSTPSLAQETINKLKKEKLNLAKQLRREQLTNALLESRIQLQAEENEELLKKLTDTQAERAQREAKPSKTIKVPLQANHRELSAKIRQLEAQNSDLIKKANAMMARLKSEPPKPVEKKSNSW